MDQYYALLEHVGVTADGNLEPLVEIGLTVTVPIMRDGELVEDPHRYVIRAAESLKEGDLARFIPGTRIVHAIDPRIIDGIRQSELFEPCDKPSKAQAEKMAKALTDAREESGSHNGDPDPTNPDNPVDETKKGGE